jgi:protein TonB
LKKRCDKNMKKFRLWLGSSFFSILIHSLIIIGVAVSWGTAKKLEPKERTPIEIELVSTVSAEPLPNEPLLPETSPQPAAVTPERIEPEKAAAPTPQPITPNIPPAAPSAAPMPVYSLASGQTASSGTAVAAAATQASGTGTNTASKPSGKPDRKAHPTYAPSPEYPVDARTDDVEGKVYIRVWIDENGSVQETQISRSSGSSSLDQAALSALRRWRFAPTYSNGSPVADRIIVPVSFNMRR